jgi:hypothetical protein
MQTLRKISILGIVIVVGLFAILATGISVTGLQQAYADSNQVHNNNHNNFHCDTKVSRSGTITIVGDVCSPDP